MGTGQGGAQDHWYPEIRLRSAPGRWLIAVTVLGSGIAFLDGTVVNVALPAMGKSLDTGLVGQQWIVDGYLLTLAALLLAGGAAGDRYGRRRVFVIGLVAFMAASAACGAAPTTEVLIAARVVQGVGAAALVPGSLALINSRIVTVDRGVAIGVWAGMSGVTSALGPFVGGALVDAASWRWVFLINIPLALAAVIIAVVKVPEPRARPSLVQDRFDVVGAVAATVGLAAVVYALIEGPAHGWGPMTVVAAVVGVIAIGGFVRWELHIPAPVLPPRLFAIRQFSGANVTTVAMYAALTAGTFLLSLQLQQSLGYSALAAGAATVPTTIIMLLASPLAGRLADRIGPRVPMTIGPIVAGAGMALMARIVPGAGFWPVVFPAVVVFGIGLTITVTPLTTAVLAAVPDDHVGVASGVNNAVSRLGGLLAVAVLPALAGIVAGPGEPLGPGFSRAMGMCAALCVAGGVVAAATVRSRTARRTPER